MSDNTQNGQSGSGTPQDEDNPFHGAELVLYRGEASESVGPVEPHSEVMEELGLISWSLWARFEDKGTEIPIISEASNHVWLSLDADTFNMDPADRVSDAFITAIVEMSDEEVGDGWGQPSEEAWEEMSDLERYVWQIIQQGFLTMECAEPALIIDWAESQERGINA